MISTKIVQVNPLSPDPGHIKIAAETLRRGGLVIIPTETVYGIAANMSNSDALDRLYEIKQRPRDKLFSLHIDIKEKVEDFAVNIPVAAYKLMDKFWPGPLTLILKSNSQGSIGIRMPDDKIALKVIAQANVPVVCPSANISGKPAPRNFQDAIQDLEGKVDYAIDAGDTRLGLESSIVDLTVEPLKILREGAIKIKDIEQAISTKIVLFVCTGNSCRSVMAKGLLEKKLKELGRKDVEVLSAGIMMMAGLGATEETRELLKAEGIDVSNHLSQRITRETIDKSDIILVMEKLQESRILEIAPEAKNRLFLLKEFAKISLNETIDIADPIGKSREFYSLTFATIKEAVERISHII